MGNFANSQERNREIVSFFYVVLSSRVRSGMPPDEARKDAYDAVNLRFGITKGTLLNIISAYKGSRSVNKITFQENASALIEELERANKSYAESLEKNSQLITLLKECCYDK